MFWMRWRSKYCRSPVAGRVGRRRRKAQDARARPRATWPVPIAEIAPAPSSVRHASVPHRAAVAIDDVTHRLARWMTGGRRFGPLQVVPRGRRFSPLQVVPSGRLRHRDRMSNCAARVPGRSVHERLRHSKAEPPTYSAPVRIAEGVGVHDPAPCAFDRRSRIGSQVMHELPRESLAPSLLLDDVAGATQGEHRPELAAAPRDERQRGAFVIEGGGEKPCVNTRVRPARKPSAAARCDGQ